MQNDRKKHTQDDQSQDRMRQDKSFDRGKGYDLASKRFYRRENPQAQRDSELSIILIEMKVQSHAITVLD